MTSTGGTPDRYPLSSQQELWCTNEAQGSFGPRFIVCITLRVSGRVDVDALQAALDELVVRHELLRTTIVRDASPRYQQVHPPAPVPLRVYDLPEVADRDAAAQEQLAEAESSTLEPEQLPLLRATLARFDQTDSVFSLVSHHTCCDGRSLQVLVRDLAAGYARRTGRPSDPLPTVVQYGEYARWQQEVASGPAVRENMDYWHQQLADAEVFALPTDQPVRRTHTLPYVAYPFTVDADVVDAVRRLARSSRSTLFIVVLAAFKVLAARIADTRRPVINTMIHSRGQQEYKDTVGPFLNFLALATDLDGCTSFRDVLNRVRTTCLEGYEHEVPIELIESQIPSLMANLAQPHNCDFIFGCLEHPFRESREETERDPMWLADRSSLVRKPERISEQMPGGAAWTMTVGSAGPMRGSVQFSPEEFDEQTIAGWAADFVRILTEAVAEPDRALLTAREGAAI